MSEPPSGWTLPGQQPEDPNSGPERQPPPPASQPAWGEPPPPSAWGPPPPGAAQPGWGPPPPGGQPGWSTPPGNWPNGGWSNRGPGIIPLRPLSVGEILEGSIRAMRGNPRTMVGYSAIVIAIFTVLATAPQALLLSTFLGSPLADPQRVQDLQASDVAALVGAGGLTVLVGLLQYVLTSIIVAALLIVAVDGAVRGRSLRPGQLWLRVKSRLFAVAGLALVVLVALPMVVLVGFVPGVIILVAADGGSTGTVIGVVVLVIGAVAGAICSVALYLGFWAVAAPALLLENLGVFAALGRSYRLVRGSFWRVFGISLLTGVTASILRRLFTLPFSAIGSLVVAGAASDHSFLTSLIQLGIADIGVILSGAVLYPFTTGVTALLYLDLRMRREGLDVDLMRQ